MRMVSEYLAKYYSDYPTKTRVRVGRIHPELKPELLSGGELRALGIWRRWADAVIFMPDRLILIEAAIRPQPGKISQLELYEHLLPMTPEFAAEKGKPIEKVLLFALEDPVVAALAREKGIKVVYFHPDWIDDYLKLLWPRERRASLT